MARYIFSLLAFAWATGASVLRATKDQGALVSKGRDQDRIAACTSCVKLCPISCFVGTCGIHTAYSVRKYETTNQCYSCDPTVSVGISKEGDYLKCEASESGQSSSKSPYAQQEGLKDGPQGPAIPGDAGLAALKASKSAQVAVKAATIASIWADKAAQAATAKYRELTGTGGAAGSDGPGVFDNAQQEETHQQATQIRAEEALRVSEAAHSAWKIAMASYNVQLQKMRREQLLTDQSEKTLEAAEQRSEMARGQYAAAQSESQKAIEQSMLSGGSAATKITSQAAAEELAGAAMAAHRRLVIAAKEAKDASEKISMAAAMAPCGGSGSSKNGKGAAGCECGDGCPGGQAAAVAMQQDEQGTLVRPVLPKALPPPSAPVMMNRADIAGLEPEDEEPAVPAEGQLEVPSLEQQMTQSLAEKLASPNAVQDASLFSVPQVPFSSNQVPIDGMEQPANFDLSTISALQKNSQRRMLRQGQ